MTGDRHRRDGQRDVLLQGVGERVDVVPDVLPGEPRVARVAGLGGRRTQTRPEGHGVDGTAAAPIRLDGVRKQYPDGTAPSADLSLDMPAGELVVLIGPSGCGKSTILRMINRLIEPTDGRILLDGEDVTHVDPVELRRRIGYVIQNVGLFPHQTVRRERRHRAAAARLAQGADSTARVDELLDLVGLDPARYARPLPARAVRRPAPAGRRGPRARRGPGGAAHGRAVLRGRPDRARPAAGRVPAAAGDRAKDDRLRHPRRGRGGPARRPDRGALRGRPSGAVRPHPPSCWPARPTSSWPSSSAPTGASSALR